MKNAPLAFIAGAVMAVSCGGSQKNPTDLPKIALTELRTSDLICCLESHGQNADNICAPKNQGGRCEVSNMHKPESVGACRQVISDQAECLRSKISKLGIHCTRADLCNLVE